MIRLIFSEIRFMNGMFFSKARYMIGVGFKVLARTPLPKLPPSYPRVTPPPRAYCTLYEVLCRINSVCGVFKAYFSGVLLL